MPDQTAPRHRAFLRFLRGFIPFLISPLLLLVAALAFAIADLVSLFRRKIAPRNTQPNTSAASIVIPNWNGRDLLAKYLPSVLAAAERVPGSEVIVVDNASEDGSAAFVEKHFPRARVVAL